MSRYRPNVAFILSNFSGEILLCERRDVPGCWQFPQGGTHPGESHLEALRREVREEIVLEPADYRILTSRGPYRYLYMEGKKKEGFDGQEQFYFHAKVVRDEVGVRLDGESREFRAARWIRPAAFQLEWVPPMKREVYRNVFHDFFSLQLSDRSSGEMC